MSIPQIKVSEPHKVSSKKNIFFNQLETISESNNYQHNVSPGLSYFDKKLPISPSIYIEEKNILNEVENATDFKNFASGVDENPNSVAENETSSLGLLR